MSKKKLLESSRLESTIMKCSTILRVVFLVNQRPSKSIQGLEKISNANKTTHKDPKISCKYVYSRWLTSSCQYSECSRGTWWNYTVFLCALALLSAHFLTSCKY